MDASFSARNVRSFVCTLGGLLAAVTSLAAAEPRKPNVLFIAVDDLNHWVGYLGQELYDERADPYEWTNLARDPRFAGKKSELAKFLPPTDHPDVSTPGGEPANRRAGTKQASPKAKLGRR